MPEESEASQPGRGADRDAGREDKPKRFGRDAAGSGGREPRDRGGDRYARDGDRRPQRDGDRRPQRDGDRRPARDGDRRPQRDGDRRPARDGDRRPARDGDRRPLRDGDRRPQRDGDRRPLRDGDRRPQRDGERRPQRDGDRRPQRDGDRQQRGGWSGRRGSDDRERSGRPDRGGAGRGERAPQRSNRGDRDDSRLYDRDGRAFTEQELRDRELRSVRPRHDDPDVPDDVSPSALDRVARNELKTLSKENAEWVAKHLVMAARLIDEDPVAAHQHSLSAARRAGRIGVVRETLAITAYETGDFALALRELRTFRRISGSDSQLPLMVDSERGVGRPERALELGRSVDRMTLEVPVRAALAIAMSGARLDLDQPELALAELQIPELDPTTAFPWSPDLFVALGEVLEELGRHDEAAEWRVRARVALDALSDSAGDDASETVVILEEGDDDGAVRPNDA